LLVYKDRLKPNSCEGRLKKKHAGENAPGKQQDNQSTFKEELWDHPATPPHHTTPKKTPELHFVS
jgi:hypothetical protein